jgi:hypothetical protein
MPVHFFVTAMHTLHLYMFLTMDDSFSIFGAFLVEPRLKFVLQWSVFVKLDNCLLRVNPDSYCTISRYFVLRILSLGFY